MTVESTSTDAPLGGTGASSERPRLLSTWRPEPASDGRWGVVPTCLSQRSGSFGCVASPSRHTGVGSGAGSQHSCPSGRARQHFRLLPRADLGADMQSSGGPDAGPGIAGAGDSVGGGLVGDCHLVLLMSWDASGLSVADPRSEVLKKPWRFHGEILKSMHEPVQVAIVGRRFSTAISKATSATRSRRRRLVGRVPHLLDAVARRRLVNRPRTVERPSEPLCRWVDARPHRSEANTEAQGSPFS